MRMYLRTVKYLYEMFLTRGGYQSQSPIVKPFYMFGVLCLCICIAIPITTACLRLADVTFYNPY